MNSDGKHPHAASADSRNEALTNQCRDGREISDIPDSKPRKSRDEISGKTIHISQDDAQSIPADNDPDDPVSR